MNAFGFRNFIITAAAFAWVYAATLLGMVAVIGACVAVYICALKVWRRFIHSKWYHKVIDLWFKIKFPFIRPREEAKFAVVNVPHWISSRRKTEESSNE